jgi:hypothetical protein
MSPESIFNLQLILGYVAWILCFRAYVLPRLKSMDQVAAHRAIATVHSLAGLYSSRCRRQSARWLRHVLRPLGPGNPDARHPRASYDKDTSALLVVRRGLQSRGSGRPYPRLLPRHAGRPSCAGRAVGRHICNPDHLRARADDHARRRILFAAASSAQAGSSFRRRCGGILVRIPACVFSSS